MSSPSLTRFRILAPELSAVTDDVVNDAIATASSRLDGGSAFDTRDALDAVVEFAAHLIASRPRAGAGAGAAVGTGALTAQSDGIVSRSYSVPPGAVGSSAWSAWLSKTTHGQAFLALVASQGFGVRGVRMGY